LDINTLKSASPNSTLFSKRFLHPTLILFVVVIATKFISQLLIHVDKGLIHTILELITIIITTSSFVIFWNTYDNIYHEYRLIGFCFLSITLLEVLHTFYHAYLNLYPEGYSQLSSSYQLLSRVVQVIILAISISGRVKLKKNKTIYTLNTIMLTLSMVISVPIILKLFNYLNITHTTVGFIIVFRYVLVITYILMLLALIKDRHKINSFSNSSIEAAIILVIPYEFLSIFDSNFNSFYLVLCHVFKICFFFYLAKGILIRAFEAPKTEIENLIKEKEHWFEVAFNYVTISISLAALEGNYLKVNTALCNMLGYSKEEFENLSFQELTHPDDLPLDLYNYDKIVNGKLNTFSLEKRYVHKLGHPVWTFVSVTLVRDEKGNPKYSIAEIHDITDKKRAEELENKIEEKNKLINETLELDRLRTEFFANLSHEFKTPLNVIFSALQLQELYLKNDITTNVYNYEKNIKTIRQNCFRLLRLLNNLIDVTKIDVGFYKLKRCNVDIVNLVEEITQSVAEYTENKGINLIFDTEIEEKVIACDVDKMERIILNLLANAIKFTDEKGHIYVNVFDRDDIIQISVKDTGIGIPIDKQDIIFERFRQVDKSLARNQEGSGIGLSLVKSLIEMQGGRVYINREYTEGSEFIIELPANATADVNDDIVSNFNADIHKNRIDRIHIEFSDIYL
jgi:PAS domain S-box-containing protein